MNTTEAPAKDHGSLIEATLTLARDMGNRLSRRVKVRSSGGWGTREHNNNPQSWYAYIDSAYACRRSVLNLPMNISEEQVGNEELPACY